MKGFWRSCSLNDMIARKDYAQCVAEFEDGAVWLIFDPNQSDDYNAQLVKALAVEGTRRVSCGEADGAMIRARRQRDRVINPLVWDALISASEAAGTPADLPEHSGKSLQDSGYADAT
jgi:hypothetical protein